MRNRNPTPSCGGVQSNREMPPGRSLTTWTLRCHWSLTLGVALVFGLFVAGPVARAAYDAADAGEVFGSMLYADYALEAYQRTECPNHYQPPFESARMELRKSIDDLMDGLSTQDRESANRFLHSQAAADARIQVEARMAKTLQFFRDQGASWDFACGAVYAGIVMQSLERAHARWVALTQRGTK